MTSGKLAKSEATLKQKTLKQRQLLSKSGFVVWIAPLSLSHDMRIQMKKSINLLFYQFYFVHFFLTLHVQFDIVMYQCTVVVKLNLYVSV